MELLLIRHARAEDRDVFSHSGLSDNERPLTDDGIERMIQAAKGLSRIYPSLDLVLTSPLRRARQTAELVANRYQCKSRITDALSPDSDAAILLEELSNLNHKRIALVGHEPDLGLLGCRLLSASRDSYIPLKKGSALLLDCPDKPAIASAHLCWMLTPKQLRTLAS